MRSSGHAVLCLKMATVSSHQTIGIICVRVKEIKNEIGTSESDECAIFDHFQLCSQADQLKQILSLEIFYCSDILENNSVANKHIFLNV